MKESTVAMSGLPTSIGDVDEVRAHLIGAARAGQALTYSELLERLGHGFSRPKMRALCVTLGAVDRAGAVRGEPALAVLVVRQSDGLPGQGWWVESAAEAGYRGSWEGADAAHYVAGLQRAVFAWWAERSP